jgi:site-specific DNA-methyltransferase (adenine-specific)/site-specific DNA-methyltransferase (cytosine-N4-specific)
MQIRDRIVELRRVKARELKPSPHNWRRHPEAQREALRGVLAEIGYAGACLARELDSGDLELIDGHLRTEETPDQDVPVLVLDLDAEEAATLIATFDPIGALAETDAKSLHELLDGRQAADSRLQGFMDGLAQTSLRELMASAEAPAAPAAEVDRGAELQKTWGTKPGQLWEIPGKAGVHRVLCGDSTKAEDVGRVCGGKVDGCFTSPPYAEQRKEQYGGIPADKYVEWWEAVQGCVRNVLAEDGSFFVNIKPHCEDGERVLYVFDLVLGMKRCWGWRFVEEFCWKSSGIPGLPRKRLKNQFEPIYQFATSKEYQFRPAQVMHASNREFHTADGNLKSMQGQAGCDMSKNATFVDGQAYPGNVISAKVDSHGGAGSGHAAAFPVGLPSFFIRGFSGLDDSWLDPFLGSGTTLVACEQLGRIGYGIEIHPKYVAVTLERLKGLGLEPRQAKPAKRAKTRRPASKGQQKGQQGQQKGEQKGEQGEHVEKATKKAAKRARK